ncbi:MAG: hypothetical protein ABI835_14945, partial [Chloroflexota bacterium]
MMKKKFGMMVVAVIAAISVVGVVSAQQAQPSQPPAPFAEGRGGREGGQEPILRQLLQIVSGDLGIAPGDLITQLHDQTLADVITANGGSVDAISAEITAALTERINSAITDGNLSQERADELLADLATTIDQAINGEFSGLRGELRGGRRGETRPGLGGGWLEQFHDTRPLISAAADATGLTGQEIAQEMRTNGSTLGEVITAHNGDPTAV